MAKMFSGKKPEREEKQTAPDWTDFRDKLGRTWAEKVKVRNRLSSQKKDLEDQIAVINADLLKGMKQIPELSVMVDGTKVTYVESSRRTIKADLLLAKGVAPDVIEDCTETSVSEFVKVTPPRED